MPGFVERASDSVRAALRWLQPKEHFDHSIWELVLFITLGAALALGAAVGLAWVAGFEKVWDRISHPNTIWIPIAFAGQVGAYLGYRFYLSHQPYEWSGTVEVRTINVGSRAGGRVKEVLVREGERVIAGQPLVVLEPGDLEAQKLMAEGTDWRFITELKKELKA